MKFLASATFIATVIAASDAAKPLRGAENAERNLKNPAKAKGREKSGKAYGYHYCATNLSTVWDDAIYNERTCESTKRSTDGGVTTINFQAIIDNTDFCGCEWVDDECEEIEQVDTDGDGVADACP